MTYSQITDGLFIGGPPSPACTGMLQGLGVRLIICMRIWRGRPVAADASLRYLWLPTFDSPLLPIPVRVLVRGARAALDVLGAGGKVYTYCARGRHRSVAMGAAILIAEGLTAEQAIKLIRERRAEADPDAFYIRRRIHLFARIWSESDARLWGTGPAIGPALDDMHSGATSSSLPDSGGNGQTRMKPGSGPRTLPSPGPVPSSDPGKLPGR